MKLISFFSFILLFFSLAIFAQAEEVVEFSAVYTIEENGEVEVVEIITYDFGEENRHGIFRTLTDNHPQSATSWYKTRYVEIDVESVRKDNESEPYEINDFGGEYEIKIGDADVFISGVHTYTIKYKLSGALSYGEDGSELYWNATGNEWEVSIAKAQVEVRGEMIEGNVICYQGVVRSTEGCEVVESEETVVFSATDLAAGEGVTIAVELDPEQVATLVIERTANYLNIGLQILVFLGLFIWLLRWHGEAKINKPVIAQYEPYENYLPMYTGVLFDKYLNPQDVTAGILYLAEQGFLSITKTEKKSFLVFTTSDYDIALLKPLSEIPTNFLKSLMGLLFEENAEVGTTVAISSLTKKQTENYKIITKLQSDILADIKAHGFIKKDHLFSDTKNLFGLIIFAVLLAGWSFILLAVCAVLILIFVVISRRTTKGYEARNHIEGFKLFLSVTEKERYKFFNAPQLSPELFMKYLPYAVALKVETQWAKVFEGITIPNPPWYHSNTAGSFSAMALASDLGTFSSTFSASSGTSGSSGGGSSGGGGGGGGGGSW